ncbi:MAG: histone deacetylase family protein [Moorellales bacterium]
MYHHRFRLVYDTDPAAGPGRMESVMEALGNRYPIVVPEPAGEEEALLVHHPQHLARVKRHKAVYEMALLAVGGAIKAAELALTGEPAFAAVRPPGHHASPNYAWDFCWLNNVAVAVQKLRREGRVNRVLVVDFDLHYGDGTANAFEGVPEVTYWHLAGGSRERFFDDLERSLEKAGEAELLAVSAGFDRHEEDWGGLLRTEDYRTIGARLKSTGLPVFAVLEGGYNHLALGVSVRAFLEGLAQ